MDSSVDTSGDLRLLEGLLEPEKGGVGISLPSRYHPPRMPALATRLALGRLWWAVVYPRSYDLLHRYVRCRSIIYTYPGLVHALDMSSDQPTRGSLWWQLPRGGRVAEYHSTAGGATGGLPGGCVFVVRGGAARLMPECPGLFDWLGSRAPEHGEACRIPFAHYALPMQRRFLRGYGACFLGRHGDTYGPVRSRRLLPVGGRPGVLMSNSLDTGCSAL
jgi:hypothetical protein